MSDPAPTTRETIARLEALLDTGASGAVTEDGATVNVDPAAIRRRLTELRARLAREEGRSVRRRTGLRLRPVNLGS